MFAQPQQEHHWLQPLAGEWKFESDCVGPDGAAEQSSGRAVGRTLGGMWFVVESQGDMGETPWNSLMTVGYDPEQAAYVGTFVGSMMNRIWHYKGNIDPQEQKLVLDTRGPKFDGPGTAEYQDMVQIVDDDHWILSSRVKADSGEWIDFMTSHHYRQK